MSTTRNIVLVGFMGTGKTSVGRKLAELLEMTFVDMDDMLEERAGKPISEIFATEGEPSFRAMERVLVQELAARESLVIATGGGVVLNPDNIADYSRSGMVVCLSATPEVILARVAAETHRPLLEGTDDKMAKMLPILETRRELYGAIPLQVDTSGLTLDAVVQRVTSMYEDTSPT